MFIKRQREIGPWLARLVERAILDLRVVSWSPMYEASLRVRKFLDETKRKTLKQKQTNGTVVYSHNGMID